MMNKLVSLLRSPYPVLFQRWKSVVIPSAIVAFILYAFQPFGISLKEGSNLCCAIGWGAMPAGASVICHYLLPALFPSYYKEQHWTLGKYVLDLLLLFFLIAVGLWLYISWLSGIGMNGSLFLLVCTWVMILAPFPLVFCLIWNRNMVLARNLKEAAEINSFLPRKMSAEGGGSSPEKKEGDTGRLVFSGGTKDVLEVSDCDFLYAEAEGNYVRVVFAAAGDGKPVRKLLRITMKQAEETVARCPLIIRCHRAFLVNVQKVVEVYGNSQGCRLRLGGCREEVPVSRACVKQVKALIEDRV